MSQAKTPPSGAPPAAVGSSPAAPRKPGEDAANDLLFTLGLALAALIPRLFVAIAWAREPVWDGHYYHFGAERIAAGLGYSEDVLINGAAVWKPWCHYPVGYSALLGAVYAVTGPALWVAPALNALLGAGLVAAVHRLAQRWLSKTRARAAGVIAAVHPGLILYSAVVMTEGLAALLLIAAPLALLRYRGQRGALFGGALIGLATLVRPASLLAAPALALLCRGRRPRAMTGVLASLVALLVVTPWTIRNCLVMDGCALVSTNGGWNLAIGALTETGRFRTLRAADGCPVVTGQVQQDRCWAAVGRQIIARDPLRWVRMMPKKLGHTYDHESFAVEYLREADPAAWPEARRTLGRQVLSLFHRLLLVVAAFSVVSISLPRREQLRQWLPQASLAAVLAALAAYAAFNIQHPFFWLAVAAPLIALLPLPGRPPLGAVGRYLLCIFAATSATHAVFFGDDRYHLVITPALCILAAGVGRRMTRDEGNNKLSPS